MQKKSIDTTLTFLVLGLMIFGMVMISSVSVYSSFKITSELLAKGRIDEVGNAFYLVRNISHVVVSILMLIIFTKTPYQIFEKHAPWIFGVALCVILMVFIPGIGAEYNGAIGWIDIPGLPSIQPVEFMKLALIIMLAYFMKKRRSRLADFYQ